MYSAAKLSWLVDAHQRPSLRLGTIDAWLLDRLTGGREYAIEAGNAARTLLFDITRLDWDVDLCALFGVPMSVLPPVRASAGALGVTAGVDGIPDGIPILAILGDSHAALYGHTALTPGLAGLGKATYGTGSSVMIPTTSGSDRRPGVSTTLSWLLDAPSWALEANILYSGAGLDWLAGILGVAGGRALGELAAEADSSDGVTIVPALAGLGAPWWEPCAVGTLVGMTAGPSRAAIARAGLDAVAHQIADCVDAMTGPLPGARPDSAQASAAPPALHAGGGATANDQLMQIQANLLGREVLVSPVADISPLGAGALAAQQLGYQPVPDVAVRSVLPDPGFTVERRVAERVRWRDGLRRAGVTVPTNQSPTER
jgi:glycerol kinase